MKRILKLSYFKTSFLLLFFLIATELPAQKKRNDLEKEKQENQQKLAESTKILEETRTKKTSTIGQLTALSNQIKQKNKIITTYEKEIKLLDGEIYVIEKNINSLKVQLASLKREYAVMIYSASKSNDNYTKLLFLFSSKDFHQLVMRLKFFKYYSQERQKQADHIKKIATKLRIQRQDLYSKRNEKAEVLGTIKIENTNLSYLKGEQESTVKLLTEQEAKLMDEIDERKKALKKLEKLITDLLKREMEKAAAQAKLDEKNKKTPEANKISGSFSNNKSKLFWPVEHGFISEKFGKHQHPVFHHVTTENLGVNIQTGKNEKVRSVFEGTVTAVTEVPGMNNVIMIQHGEYYTFYAKLKTVFVKGGQKVKAKEAIGEVFTDADEVSELQFQIWKGNDKQDPQDWLYDR